MHKKVLYGASTLLFGIFLACILSVIGCSSAKKSRFTVWTNQSDFAAYAELFNAAQDDVKMIVIYKENPVEEFPIANDEEPPDILVGPWLKNERIRGNFLPIDYMFTDQLISRAQFYPSLLELGSVDSIHYLLPVSFNLSAVAFSADYSDLIEENYMLSPNQIRDTSTIMNKTYDNVYTAMGFASRWAPEFLYEITKLHGANFAEIEEGIDTFSWDQLAVDNAVEYLRDWTRTINTSTKDENDYQFKYLYNPPIKQISEKKCFFTYITSDDLFSTPQEKLSNIDFRWIQQDTAMSIQDDMIFMGLYKYSKNLAAAEQFVIWFMNEENQRGMLQWRNDMNLYTNSFGISGGFSSIRSVNERIFPTFYPTLLRNLPVAEFLLPPNKLPAEWADITENVIIPYLLDATDTANTAPTQTIQERLAEWKRLTY